MDILHAIGNTSMLRLRKVVPRKFADVFVKLEWENPTGSLKDRMAHAVISRAEADGRLKPGDTVVEYTGGSTGASLAMVCAAKGYRIQIVSSDAFSQEKLDQMAALGAELTLVPSEEAHRAGRGPIRRDVLGGKRRRCDSGRRAAGARGQGGHADGRLWPEVPEHRCVQKPVGHGLISVRYQRPAECADL